MKCPSCGAPLKEDAQFCTACGAKVVSEPAEMKAPEVVPEPVVTAAPAVCPKCGAPRTGSDAFCTACGAPFEAKAPEQPSAPSALPQGWMEIPAQTETPQAPQAAQMPQQPMMQAQAQEAPRPAAPSFAEPAPMVQPNFGTAPKNLKEFVGLFGDDKTRKTMKYASIILYVFAALNLVAALMNETLPLDSIILAALGFWYQKSYSNTCAIVLLAYAVLSVVLTFLMTGTISGWLILILAVLVFSTTQKAQKAFDQYQKTGQTPQL